MFEVAHADSHLGHFWWWRRFLMKSNKTLQVVCLHRFTIPPSSLYFYERSRKTDASFASSCVAWHAAAQRKGLRGVRPTGDETRCQKVTRTTLLRYLHWCLERCYLSSTGIKLRSYILPSYLLERLYNEIDWESLKNSQKQKERGGRMRSTKTSDCCTMRQMTPR